MNKALHKTWLLVGILSCTNSPASELYTCTSNTHVRNVWLNYPTAQQVPCAVVYEKPTEDGSKRTLWEAQSKTGFCEEKASELLANLGKGGWECSKVAARSGSAPNAISRYLPLQATGKPRKAVPLTIVSPIVMIDVNGKAVRFRAKVKKAGCLNGREVEYAGIIDAAAETGAYLSVMSESALPATGKQLLYVRFYCRNADDCGRGHGFIDVWGKTGRDGLEHLERYESVYKNEITEAGVQVADDARGTELDKVADTGSARPGDADTDKLLELDRLSCAFGVIDESASEQPVHSVLANAQFYIDVFKKEIELSLLKETLGIWEPVTPCYDEIIEGDVDLDGDSDFILPYTIEGRYGGSDFQRHLQIFISTGGVYAKALEDFYDIGSKGYAVRFTGIRDGLLVGDELQFDTDNAPCCPASGKNQYFKLVNNELQQVDAPAAAGANSGDGMSTSRQMEKE